MDFTLIRGDSAVLEIDLTLAGEAYDAPDGTSFIFTAKQANSDDDDSSAFQKTTGAGLTYEDSSATVVLVHIDTRDLSPQTLVYDIQATEPTGAVRTVARGLLVVTVDVTIGTDTSVPIYTTNPTAFQSAAEYAAAAEAARDLAQEYADIVNPSNFVTTSALDAEVARATSAEEANAAAIAAETARATTAEAGKQPLATVLTNTTASFTTAQQTKLTGVATGATANSPDATLLARANHTGTQLASTISDFSSAVVAAAPVQSVAGRTGVVTLAKADVGLPLVDNTSDASKPVSTAQAAADAVVLASASSDATTKANAAQSAASSDATTKANAAAAYAIGVAAADATAKVLVETNRATAAEALKAPSESPAFTGTVSMTYLEGYGDFQWGNLGQYFTIDQFGRCETNRLTAGDIISDGGLVVTDGAGQLTAVGFVGPLTGNATTATTATALATARAINGVAFNGTAPITVTAAAGTLTGTTLNSTVVTSSLTSVGTLSSGAVPTTLLTGTVTNAQLAGSIAASKLVGSDIATVGTLTGGATGAGFTVALGTSTISGTLPAANTAAQTGDVTKPAGSNVTTLASIPAISGANLTAVPSNTALYPTLNQNTTGTASGLSSTLAVASGGTGQTSYTNGQLLIGNTTGNTLAKGTITGTSNQIVVTNGAGSITLSTPQDIGTGSSVVFNALQTPTINGSTSANGTITIQGTTSGTRTTSYVNLQPNGGFVGIGTATPVFLFHSESAGVAGLFRTTGSSTDALYIQSSSASGYSSIGFLNSGGSSVGSFGYGNASAAGPTDRVFFNANSKAMGFSVNNGSSNAISIATTNVVSLIGDLAITTAGKGLQLKSGTNARAGNATLVAGTVTVSNTSVTANTLVTLTRKTSGGTIGTAITYTLSAGTSFTINSDNPLDTSTFTYMLIELN